MSTTTRVISQKKLKECLHYDPETGLFTWISKVADKINIGDRAGSMKDGYRCIRIEGVRYREHRLAFIYMTGSCPEQVDHQNHIKDDNRWENLAPSTYADNNKNHPLTKRNTTGVVGVSQRKDGKYIARIYLNKKHVFLGSFSTLEEAASVRSAANKSNGFHQNHGKVQ